MSLLDSWPLFFCRLIGNPSVKWAQTWSMRSRLFFIYFFFVVVIFKSTLGTDQCGDSSKAPAGQGGKRKRKLPKQTTQRNEMSSMTRHCIKIWTVHMQQRLPSPPAANHANAGPPAQWCRSQDSALRLEGCGFDSRPAHTNDSNNASLLGTEYSGSDSNQLPPGVVV